VLEDCIQPTMLFSGSDMPMSFDIYVPVLHLALEYQGMQHYHHHNIFGTTMFRQQRDEEKRKACKNAGITLLEVPYWWQHDKESIVAAIFKLRPEVFLTEPSNR